MGSRCVPDTWFDSLFIFTRALITVIYLANSRFSANMWPLSHRIVIVSTYGQDIFRWSGVQICYMRLWNSRKSMDFFDSQCSMYYLTASGSYMNEWTVQCRMFANVSALKIHMSKNAYDALNAFPGFITECRDHIRDEVVIDFLVKIVFLLPLFIKIDSQTRNSELKKKSVVFRRWRHVLLMQRAKSIVGWRLCFGVEERASAMPLLSRKMKQEWGQATIGIIDVY